jgi:ATP-dependent Clp protease ATP-binding subunit ClpC
MGNASQLGEQVLALIAEGRQQLVQRAGAVSGGCAVGAAARRVLTLAVGEAQRLHHGYVGTGHLLLGVLGDAQQPCVQQLSALGVDEGRVRPIFGRLVSHVAGSPRGTLVVAPAAERALDRALQEAVHLHQDTLMPHHLLLGLARHNQGLGALILESLDVDLARLRASTRRAIRRAGVPRAAGLRRPTAPTAP